eukprot:1429191-Rhodomonas_salina.2
MPKTVFCTGRICKTRRKANLNCCCTSAGTHRRDLIRTKMKEMHQPDIWQPHCPMPQFAVVLGETFGD